MKLEDPFYIRDAAMVRKGGPIACEYCGKPVKIDGTNGEVSELWEAYRKGILDKPIPLTCEEDGLAGIIIRALDIAEQLGLDIHSDTAERWRNKWHKT